jgi:hypothetical protein
MQTAANTTTAPGDWQRDASTPKAAGVPHVLARLPDLRPAKQQPVEPPVASYTPPSKPAPVIQAPPVLPKVAREIEELTTGPTSEFFEPQVLPSFERVWESGRTWLSKHAKVAMVVVAMLASHGMLLMWRQAPAEHEQSLQPLVETFESSTEETAQLHPIPMENEASSADREEGSRLADAPGLDEPHLALPRPEPDPISMSAPPRFGAQENPAAQPKLAAAADTWPNEGKSAEQEKLSEAPSATAGNTDEATAAKDVPPWESWSDEKRSTPTAAQAIEAAAQAAPRLTPPDGSGGIQTAPEEARTASLSPDRPSSRAGSTQRPRSVAKLKGIINKSLAEPAHEHVRRSLY